jgi:glycosyltransferase involved in cell wall biosynthesis
MELEPSGKLVDKLRDILPQDAVIAMYVGNLEHYQGIDLLVDAMAEIPDCDRLHMVLIGGSDNDIEHYRARTDTAGIAGKFTFLGRRPVSDLMLYLEQADILVSPRIKGVNTPMKVYSYMGAGRAIIATDIASHTQVLDNDSAVLVASEPELFAAGLARLCQQPALRDSCSAASLELANSRHTYNVFEKKLRSVYKQLEDGVHAA